MKILFVSFLLGSEYGGAPSVVLTLSRELIKLGHSITILTSHKEARSVIENLDGIKIIRVYPPNIYWIGNKDFQPVWKKFFWQIIDTWNPFVVQMVERILAQEKPDLVHTHKFRGFSPSSWSAASSAGIPIIHTAHDFELISPQGTLSGRVGRMAQRRSILIRPYQAIRARASQSVAAFTSPSQFLLDGHLNCGFFPRSIHKVIPNAHNIPPQKDASPENTGSKERKPGDPIRFLYLGRLDPEKGIDRFCQSFEKVARLKAGFHLKIGGTGMLENSLRARYGANPAFEFVGWLNAEDKWNALSECDFVVIPSICQEAFGISAVEGLAAGKPVLASRIGGLPEIIQDGVTGWLVTPGDDIAWRAALQRLLVEKENLNGMTSACINQAEKYTSESITSLYLSLYQRLLEK